MSLAEATDRPNFARTPSIQEQQIARVYAAALLNAAEDAGKAEEVKAELDELVLKTFYDQPQLEDLLASGAVSKAAKEQTLRSLFEGKASKLLFHTLLVLNEHYRLDLLRAIHLVFNRLLDQRQRRIVVQVTTAVPLPQDQADRLTRFLRDNLKLEPTLDVTVDPDILGGMTIRLGDWLFDRSVRTELESIRKQLIARSSHEIQSRRDRFSNTAGDR